METLLLVPVDDSVVFPNMSLTLGIDVGDEERVVLVPRNGDDFAYANEEAVRRLLQVPFDQQPNMDPEREWFIASRGGWGRRAVANRARPASCGRRR